MSNTSRRDRPSIVVGITSPGSTPLLEGQLRYFSSQNYEVQLAAPRSENTLQFCEREGCTLLAIKIERDISPDSDFRSLVQLIREFRRLRPDIVNVGTPKMGLLGALAAWLLRVPARFYTCRGLRYEHETGSRLRLLKALEWVAGKCAHRIICISPSVQQKGIADGVFSESKTVVIGPGSSNGIDLERFDPAAVDPSRVAALREELDLEGRMVLGFVGRLIDRKGIRELYEAYCVLRERGREVSLILLGSVFTSQFSDGWLLERFEADPNIHWLGFQKDVPVYMCLFDLFVLPAWWEGFGNVLVQAAAMGLPVVSTNVTGCRDAVSDGYNGVLVEKGDISALVDAIEGYLDDPDLRRIHGANGREWAARFQPQLIWDGLDDLYRKQLALARDS